MTGWPARPYPVKTSNNPMARIFVTQRIFPEAIERLRAAGHEVETREAPGPVPKEKLLNKIGEIEALVCLLTDHIDAKIVAAGSKLRMIANIAVGYENIDVAAAKSVGIVVTNTPGVLTETTADLAFALLLAAARRIPEADAYLRSGAHQHWELIQPYLGLDVHGKTLGIVGMGRIGTAVARRGRGGFGMNVLYCDHHRNDAVEAELHARFASFKTLLERSDFVSIHTPLTADTHHLFDKEAFCRMRKTAILVNAARGPIVDEAALAWALQRGEIAGAAIDVYEQEPHVHPELLALRERVVLLPHLGSATEETRRAMTRIAVDNVLAVLAGDAPLNPVALGEAA